MTESLHFLESQRVFESADDTSDFKIPKLPESRREIQPTKNKSVRENCRSMKQFGESQHLDALVPQSDTESKFGMPKGADFRRTRGSRTTFTSMSSAKKVSFSCDATFDGNLTRNRFCHYSFNKFLFK